MCNLNAKNLAPSLQNPEVLGLAEVMNYQAVANNEADILRKDPVDARHKEKD